MRGNMPQAGGNCKWRGRMAGAEAATPRRTVSKIGRGFGRPSHRYAGNFHFACRSTASGESFITSYQTVTSEPSSSCTVLG